MFRAITEICVLLAALLFPVLSAKSQPTTRDAGSKNAGATQGVSRGKYLVERVAMCVECHTPRNEKGELIRDKFLSGAPVPVKAPPYPQLDWALKAPAIAGLPGYSKAEGVRLLTEGITRDGRTPKLPMPPFRLTASDAEAVVAYLKSLE